MKNLLKFFLMILLASCSPKGKLLPESSILGNQPVAPKEPPPEPTPPNSGGGVVENYNALFVANVDGKEAIYEMKLDQSITKHLEIPEHATLNSAVKINDIIYYSLISLKYDQSSVAEVYEWNTTTSQINRISQFHQDSATGVESIAQNGNDLYAAVRTATQGVELHRYSANQWQAVKDIESGAVSGYPSYFKNLNGKLYFSAFKTNSGIELWSTDGSTTNVVVDQTAGTNSTHPYLWHSDSQKIYYTGKLNGKYDLLSVDAQGAAQLVVGPNASAEHGSNPLDVAVLSNGWISSCHHDANGREACSALNGASTWKVIEIQSGSKGSSPRFFTQHKGSIYFQATTAALGTELYKTDGQTAQLVKDLLPGDKSGYPENLWSFNEKLYFSGTDDQGPGFFSFDGRIINRLKINQKTVRYSRKLLQP